MDKQPFLAFEGKIHNWETILADHKHKERIRVMEHIYSNRFISSFWKGDYVEANKWYDLASAQQTFNLPKVQSITVAGHITRCRVLLQVLPLVRGLLTRFTDMH